MRLFFSDGVNSIAHFAFGYASYFQPWIFPVFAAYQFVDKDDNTTIDLLEYGMGTIVASIFKS